MMVDSIRNRYSKVMFLARSNTALSYRGSTAGRKTSIVIILLCILFVAATCYLFSLIGASSLAENIGLIGILVYLVVIFDVILTAGRHSIGTTIHQGHLEPFPLSPTLRSWMLFIEQTLHLKSIIFLSFALTVVLFILTVSVVAGLAATMLFLLFFCLMNVWVVVLFLVAGRIFQKNKALYPLLMLGGLSPIFLAQTGIFDSMMFGRFCTSGVIGYVGNGIAHALDGRWWMMVSIILQMIVLTVAGSGVIYLILRKKEFASYFG